MAKTYRNGNVVIRLSEIVAVQIPEGQTNRVDIITSINEKFRFHCDSHDRAIEIVNEIQDLMDGKTSNENEVLIPVWYNDSTYYPIFDKRICDLGLSVRATNIITFSLKDWGMEPTVRNLCSLAKTDVLKFRNMGIHTMCDLSDFLEARGLDFGLDVEQIEKYHQETMRKANV